MAAAAVTAATALSTVGMDFKPCWSVLVMSTGAAPSQWGFRCQSTRLSSHAVIVRTTSPRTDASSRPLRRGTRKP